VLSWFKSALPAVSPLQDFMVTVEVRLEPPSALEDGTAVVGYNRVLGVRATPDSVRIMIESCVTDGVVVWNETSIDIIADIRSIDRKFTKLLRKPFGEGAWWKSGRMLFPKWDDDPKGENVRKGWTG
jgi:hypothetical protein